MEMNMEHGKGKSSRRFFTATAVTAAAATRVAGANDRIRIGVIGAGGRGWGHIRDFSHLPDTEVVAVCDVYRTKAQRACAKGNVSPFITQDHRRVLERKDIDAVVIATCDHSHVPLLVDALEAGKDVYVEKPLTFRMADGARVAEAVPASGRSPRAGPDDRRRDRGGSERANSCPGAARRDRARGVRARSADPRRGREHAAIESAADDHRRAGRLRLPDFGGLPAGAGGAAAGPRGGVEDGLRRFSRGCPAW